MIPGSGNYVGNYPNSFSGTNPGSVVVVSTSYMSGTTYYLRDMGKTIYAAVGTGSIPGSGSKPGYFRQVQVITPSIVTSPTASTNFGVGMPPVVTGGNGAPGTSPAGNIGDAGYNTFFIPIIVGGVVASNNGGTLPLDISAAGLRIGEQL